MSEIRKRFVTYCRVSGRAQEENTSLESQAAATRKLVEESGGTVVAEYSEVVSGSLYLARSELQRAIAMVEAGEADGIAMLDLERFARHAAYQDLAYERIRRAGGEVIFCHDNFGDGPAGKLFRTIKAGVTEYYREYQRVLSMNGAVARAEAGIMPQRSRPPYGYYITKQRDVDAGRYEVAGQFVIVEEQAYWVRKIYQWRAKGAVHREICERLISRAVPTMYGGRWQMGTVYSILTNSVYMGRARFGRQKIEVDEERLREGKSHLYRRYRPESEWIYVPAPPIVSKTLWNKCQAMRVFSRTGHPLPECGE